jgi:hypothetical protein
MAGNARKSSAPSRPGTTRPQPVSHCETAIRLELAATRKWLGTLKTSLMTINERQVDKLL